MRSTLRLTRAGAQIYPVAQVGQPIRSPSGEDKLVAAILLTVKGSDRDEMSTFDIKLAQ